MWIMLISIIVFMVIYYFAYKNTHKPILKNVNLQLKNKEKLNPIKILHLSDFHMERISITPEHLYNQIDKKDVDLIALTGDYLEKTKNIAKFVEYLDVLNRIQPKYGIYVVFGNHDYLLKNNIDYFQKIIEKTGAVVLRNECKTINIEGQTINIIGIDDYKTKRSNLEKSYEGVKSGINLVLTHDPNIVLRMSNYSFDYLLSGHFHGGQIYWPIPFHLIKMGKLPKKYIFKGLNFQEEKPFYINEGLGQTLLNMRIGSRPEITLHTLI